MGWLGDGHRRTKVWVVGHPASDRVAALGRTGAWQTTGGEASTVAPTRREQKQKRRERESGERSGSPGQSRRGAEGEGMRAAGTS